MLHAGLVLPSTSLAPLKSSSVALLQSFQARAAFVSLFPSLIQAGGDVPRELISIYIQSLCASAAPRVGPGVQSPQAPSLDASFHVSLQLGSTRSVRSSGEQSSV